MPNASYDTLTITINADSKDAVASIKSLSTSLKKLEDNENSLSTFKKLLQDIAKIDFSNVAKGLQSVVSAFEAMKKHTSSSSKSTEKSVKQSAGLQVPPQGTSSDLFVGDMSKYEIPPVSQEALTSYADLRSSMIHIYDLNKQTSKSVEYTTKSIEKLGKEAKKTSTNGLKKLINQFKNIMKYRIIRKIIQEMYKALVEGLQNVASFDSGLQESLGRLQSAFTYLKNSIGAMIAPLVQILTPALEKIMMIAGDLSNEFAKLFASVNGQSTFSKATYDLKKYNEEAKKTQSLGIDELNVFQQDNKGGFVTEEVSLDKEQTELADGLKNIVGSIKELWGEILSIVKEIIANVKPLLSKVITPLSNIISIIVKLISQIVHMIGDSSNEVLYSIIEAVASLLTLISNILDLLQPIIDLIGIIISACTNGVNGAIGFVINSLVTVINFLNAIVETIKALVNGDLGKVGEIWSSVIGGMKEQWGGFVEKLGNGFKKVAEGFVNFFIRGINHVIGAFENVINWFIDGIASIASWAGIDTSGWGVSFSRVPEVSFANGGFPEDGMFFANHNELVGQFSNGQTAVANNEQIIEGIYRGVLQAMRDSGANGNGEIVVNLDGYEIARAVTKQQKNMGADLVAGANIAWGK